MISLAVRNFTARKLRALSTAAAVFFGVAMIAGTLMLTDSVNRSFDDIFATVNEGIDVTVRPKVEVEGEFGDVPLGGMEAAVLEDVEAAEGVGRAEGAIGDPSISILDEEGERIGPPSGGPPHIATSTLGEPFNSFTVVDGASPQTADEVAIDTVTAEEEGYQLGDRIRVTGTAGAKEYTLTGIGEFGSGTPLGGASLAEFTLAEAQRLTGKEGRFDEIDVDAAEGTSPEELAAVLSETLPSGLEVRTGEQTATEDASDIQEGFGFLSTALLVFAGIAVFVGAFLIFNTFSITVAQRVREFAMLRTLGASARQVLGSVLLEAALIGLLASALGILGGFGFVELIKALFKALGFELPTSGLALTADTVLIAVVVGVAATVLSALVPARRATRVAPLEALRESAGGQIDDVAERSRRRSVISSLLIFAGIAALLFGLFGGGDTGTALPILGLGLVLLFIGIAMIGDRFVAPLASAIAWPIERLRGVTGKLARENSQRQPARTAVTAAALMIGVALVVFVGVFAASVRASLEDTLDRQFAGDIAIVNTDGFSPIPSAIPDEVAALDGVGVVSPVASIAARIEPGGDEVLLAGVEPETLGEVANLDWAEGSDDTLTGLATDEAIVDRDWAEDRAIEVGETIEVTGPGGEKVEVEVAGLTDRSRFIVESVAMARAAVRSELGARDDGTIFANFAVGADPEATRDGIDALLAERFPNAEARSQQEFKDDRAAEIDQLVALIYVLLGLSVLVSIFGVVNTLSLTIFERTRELGMLRAIGTSRSQVRRMIRYESVVTALVGAIVGAVIGLGLGIAAVTALADEGLILSLSPSLAIVVLIAAVVLGVVAAIGPARRASRLNVIEALQYE